jgi:serine protease Do
LTPELSQYFSAKKGVLVEDIAPGGPAEKGGLKSGDIILTIDGIEMGNVKELQYKISNKTPGEKSKLTVLRDKKTQDMVVTIGQRPDNKTEPPVAVKEESIKWRGLSVQNLTKDIAAQLKLSVDKGVIVTGVKKGSPGADAGIETGDVIIKLNDKEINNLEDYNKITKTIKEKEEVLCRVYNGKFNTFTVIKGEK